MRLVVAVAFFFLKKRNQLCGVELIFFFFVIELIYYTHLKCPALRGLHHDTGASAER